MTFEHLSSCSEDETTAAGSAGGASSSSSSSSSSVCLVCAIVVVKPELPDGGDDDEDMLEDEHKYEIGVGDDPLAVWNFFLKLFRLGNNNRRRRGTGRGRRAKWELDKELMPLCSGCKEQVKPLMELQAKVDRLMEAIEAGVLELKDKWRRSEEAFQANRVYEADERFYLARCQVLGKEIVGKSPKELIAGAELMRYSETGRGTLTARPQRKGVVVGGSNPSRKKSSSKKVPKKRQERRRVKSEDDGDDLSEDDERKIISRGDTSNASPSPKSETKWTLPPDPLEESSTPKGGDIIEEFESVGDASSTSPRKAIIKSSTSKSRLRNRKRGSSSSLPKKKEEDSVNWELLPDDTFEDQKDPPQREPKIRKKDQDYVPEEALLLQSDGAASSDDDSQEEDNDDDHDNFDEEEDGKGKKIEYGRFQPKTGNYKFHNITLEKMGSGNQYKCTLCSELVENKYSDKYHNSNLKNHIVQKHTQLTRCKECGKSYTTMACLRGHIKRVHKGTKPSYQYKEIPCPICGKPVLRKPSRLRPHLWTHYGEEDKKEALARGEKLPRHLRTKYQCEECGRQVTSLYVLQKHMASFHKPKVEKVKELCPECGKSVVNLEEHLGRMHHAKNPNLPQPFQCPICNKTYGTKLDLYCHRKIHRKDHKCSECPKEYASATQLKNHIRNKHPSDPSSGTK